MRSVWKSPSVKRVERRGLPTKQAAQQGVLVRRMLGTPMKFDVRTEIYGEGTPVDYVYEVVTGAVRTAKVLSDGRRTVGGFYFAGDIFGLEDGDEHSLSAEALVSSTVLVMKRSTLIRLGADDRELAEELLAAAMSEVARAHRHALMLVMTAQERVNSFLVEMAQRISIGDLVSLPMLRQDIANYLGLTIETVSRMFTSLAGTSAIHRASARTIVLRNRTALERETGADVGSSSQAYRAINSTQATSRTAHPETQPSR